MDFNDGDRWRRRYFEVVSTERMTEFALRWMAATAALLLLGIQGVHLEVRWDQGFSLTVGKELGVVDARQMEILDEIIDNVSDELNAWERKFIGDLDKRRGNPLTPNQSSKLEEIYEEKIS